MSHRLLIVDDDQATRQLLERLFTRKGWDVDTAPNGTLALERAKAGGYDCVLIDCHLPEMDGPSVARALRALDAPCPPMVGTSCGDAETERPSCLDAGMSAYIAKPFALTTLVEHVESIIFGGRPREMGGSLPPDEPGNDPEPALDIQRFHSQIGPLGGAGFRSGARNRRGVLRRLRGTLRFLAEGRRNRGRADRA